MMLFHCSLHSFVYFNGKVLILHLNSLLCRRWTADNLETSGFDIGISFTAVCTNGKLNLTDC